MSTTSAATAEQPRAKTSEEKEFENILLITLGLAGITAVLWCGWLWTWLSWQLRLLCLLGAFLVATHVLVGIAEMCGVHVYVTRSTLRRTPSAGERFAARQAAN